jgi:hypothetical protein
MQVNKGKYCRQIQANTAGQAGSAGAKGMWARHVGGSRAAGLSLPDLAECQEAGQYWQKCGLVLSACLGYADV